MKKKNLNDMLPYIEYQRTRSRRRTLLAMVAIISVVCLFYALTFLVSQWEANVRHYAVSREFARAYHLWYYFAAASVGLILLWGKKVRERAWLILE